MSNQKEEQIIICKQLIESKNYDSAFKKIEEFLLKNPEDEGLLNDKGIILTKLGKYNEAIENFEKALKISEEKGIETSGIIWNNKGLAHCNIRQFRLALSCFEKSYNKKVRTTQMR